MCYCKNREDLVSFGIPEITKKLRMSGYTLQKIDSVLTPESGGYVNFVLSWTRTTPLGEKVPGGKFGVYIKKDSSGLFVEVVYNVSKTTGETRDVSTRYNLVRRESNLKTGTYRYYFQDPYTEDGICSKLYLLPHLWEFVPRSILNSYQVRYSQQRKGKTQRYFFSPKKVPDTKHRKSHYRGRVTPFWEKYEKILEENDYRFSAYCIYKGWGRGIFPPGLEEVVREDVYSHTGGKSSSRV